MLGSTLKKLRLEKKLKQIEIAEFLQVSRTTYTQYETGVSEPSLDTLKKLASFFNVSTDYLLGVSDTPTLPTNKYSDLSPDGQKDVEEYADMVRLKEQVKASNVESLKKA